MNMIMKRISVITNKMSKIKMNNLYDKKSLEIMRNAEESLEIKANRVKEIKDFARKSGIKRIGIAHCISVPEETKAVEAFLSDEFEVFRVDCKCGHIKKNEMLGGEGNSIICNPAGQAEYLESKDTELNISMGLCVGHDMIFNQKSVAPVSVLLIKDRANKNNPLESIHNLK
jgi:uncharacterized metal-binding protein